MDDTTLQLQWRGMNLTLSYDHRLWGGAKDRVFVQADERFYKNGPDYLPIFFPSFDAPLSKDDIFTIAEIWLDEWLERCARMREADVIRSQLELF